MADVISGAASTVAPEQPKRPERTGSARFTPITLLIGLVLVAGFVALRMASGLTFGITQVSDAVTLAVSVLVEVIPFVILGILIAVVIQVWLPQQAMLRVLPRNAFLRRVTLSLAGVLLPVCECGNVPVARSFLMEGLRVSDAVTFLFAAPILNPITIITTYSAFGWSDVFVGRIVGGFLIANLVGWIFSLAPNDQTLLTNRFNATCELREHESKLSKRGAAVSAGAVGSTGFGYKLSQSAGIFGHEASEIFPALVIGAALAGTIQVLVPRDILLALGTDPIWSVLALMALAFIVAICSNVDAFFILAFSTAFLPGAVIAFLVFGPMIDIKMVNLLRSTFKTRTVIAFAVLIGAATLALGMGVNALGL